MATQTRERQQIIKAINDLKLKVTPSDVAAKTGLPILHVTSELNRIATDTNAHLQVSEQGDIAYKFNPNIEGAYMAQGLRRVMDRIGSKTLSILFFLVRISFGIMLIVSLIVVSVLIVFFFIIISQRGGSNDSHGDGLFGGHGGGFHFSFFDYLILRDLMYWGTASAYRSRYRLDEPTVRRPDQGNFLFNVFSFLFGDGNPNQNLEERKWAMVAKVIQNSGGVVTSEQLAPYTGADPNDEDAVLPVLTRFDGRPEVTDKGNIVYAFPSLTVTTLDSELTSLPSYLNEWKWKFSNVDDGGLVPVYILGGLNFFGSFFLLFTAMNPYVYTEMGRQMTNPMHGFLPLIIVLLTYGALFLVVPAVRYLIQTNLNVKIDNRNEKRARNAALLQAPPDQLLQKLAEAQTMKMDRRILTDDNAIYDTRKDDMDQKYKDDLEKRFDATP